MKCPFCGKRLKADYPEGWYNCNSCGDRFYNDGGNLLTVRQMRAKRNHRTCVLKAGNTLHLGRMGIILMDIPSALIVVASIMIKDNKELLSMC